MNHNKRGGFGTVMRNRLRELREQRGWDQTEVASRAGVTQPAYSKLERGLTKWSMQWAERLALIYEMSPEELYGKIRAAELDVAQSFPIVKVAPVLGTAAAGMWMESLETSDVTEEVPYVPERFPHLNQFAFRVVGSSMNQRIADGEYVICVDYTDAKGGIFGSGDIVVVERQRGDLVERTVKELRLTNSHFELWPRSTDPRHQSPIRVPRETLTEDDGTVVRIIGLAVGKFGRF